MLLATRCPFCETIFRLQPEQLALRRGLVRCGHCHEVFDATSSLYELAASGDFSNATPVSPAAAVALTASPPPAPQAPKTPDFGADAWNPWAPVADAVIDNRLLHSAATLPLSPVSSSVAITPRHVEEPQLPPESVESHAAIRAEPVFTDTAEPFLAEHAQAEPEPVAVPTAARAAAPAPAPSHEPVREAAPAWRAVERPEEEPELQDAQAAAATLRTTPPDSEPHFGPATGAAAAATPEPFAFNPARDDEDPFPVVRETRAAPPRRIGWQIFGALIALILLITLLAQVAWWQREIIMVSWPDSQSLYAQACEQLGCTVMPPHDIDGLQVEPSDLRQIDGPHKLELKMPLRNRSNVALAYPAIELTLLDDQNNVAVRRVLWPQDYVKPGTPIASGLPPRTTQTMIVHLDTGNAVASNFRVQIFYP
ncbi:zinc-ribbon and DUF3426 domain-containing protein [Paraburkholderia sp.]|uniref:zinc-ribbon and DUF3426 domain-containing protein n=1 Tax=Paraburkholderia sp. TaxID=1926495 RepID=UPI002F42B12F